MMLRKRRNPEEGEPEELPEAPKPEMPIAPEAPAEERVVGKPKYIKGIKCGLLAGIFYGILSELFAIGFVFVTTYGKPFPQMTFFSFVAGLIFSILIGLLGGFAFGLIYARFYDNLPTLNPKTKGVILSLAFWLAVGLLIKYSVLSLNLMITTLFASLVWGLLIGIFWVKFE